MANREESDVINPKDPQAAAKFASGQQGFRSDRMTIDAYKRGKARKVIFKPGRKATVKT